MRQAILRLASWVTLLRFGPTARGILPFLLGAVIALSQGHSIDGVVLALSALAVFCIMEVTFLINEYFDLEADTMNRSFHKLSGGSRILPLGLVSPARAIITAFILAATCGIIGLLLQFYFHTGPFTLLLGIVGLTLGFFYTAKPIQLSYKGAGEITILFTCGFLATITGYYLQVGHFDTVATLASIPGGISVFLVILANEFPDGPSDRASGKKTLVVTLGTEGAARLYAFFLLLCYATIIVITFFDVPEVSLYLSLFLIPLIMWNILGLRKRNALRDNQMLEGLSLRTMLIDHLITIIYTVSFIWAGWSFLSTGELWGMIAAYTVVFCMEIGGIITSAYVFKSQGKAVL
jgi:1,4-dihydroxy-2-naphthoate octaprenyltransferase